MKRAHYDGTELRRYMETVSRAPRRVVERTGQLAETSAKRNAPVDTGNMRDSTHFAMEGDDRGTIYADADYSGYVEFGTWRQAAQPWFTPAVEEARRAMPQIAAEELKP